MQNYGVWGLGVDGFIYAKNLYVVVVKTPWIVSSVLGVPRVGLIVSLIHGGLNALPPREFNIYLYMSYQQIIHVNKYVKHTKIN